tara:strand:+ start:4849 stop:5142 length:294 start_codon:yes stop_codon:yes gene_type:complete
MKNKRRTLKNKRGGYIGSIIEGLSNRARHAAATAKVAAEGLLSERAEGLMPNNGSSRVEPPQNAGKRRRRTNRRKRKTNKRKAKKGRSKRRRSKTRR